MLGFVNRRAHIYLIEVLEFPRPLRFLRRRPQHFQYGIFQFLFGLIIELAEYCRIQSVDL